MKTEDKIKVMQAYVDGRVIQYRQLCDNWKDVSDPRWDWIKYQYRIKPEPKIVPYKEPEIEWIGKKIIDKVNNDKFTIYGINRSWDEFEEPKDGVWMVNFLNHEPLIDVDDSVNLENFLSEFTWQDGSPCGEVSNE